ncbi:MULTISPECIES: OsmC family protein [Paracoccus]|jgi:osmotically inducible protein OsmC|uniref:OsmC family protein n=1 Tax=Paracoccus denitrificans (strain Pd 1222) TaxID=318586 RepID=A1B0J1_PARDP|nr:MULTISPECIES: OsmC family protein [Paracoccus]ABL69035.1 OsmC family protein [Paracoccus denitrificans PD1222]MBB4629891.1 osmotically inducible protein OsmC [Paracoccus denitrificans]MCU7431251.1 OsmC family protein [Paracoccus denitrificans]MDK8875353.1 OsmC family protein [Paracoccus sp. SSJ]QAR27070.1 OsmC family peroxiredoxin [Paracoccus denitrificans]
MIVNSGSAKWEGGLKDGKGALSTKSGALSNQPYGFNTRFEGLPGTNPEELIGAAHAACFSMALSAILQEAGIGNVRIETTSEIGLAKEGDGFAIKTAHLNTRVWGDGDKAVIEECARKAEKGCPVSKVLNAEVTMDVTVG